MKRKILIFVVLSISYTYFVCSAQDQASPNNLWAKAVEIASQNTQWTPGYMHSTVVMKDKKGNILESEDTEIRFFEDDAGEIQTEVISGGKSTSASSSSNANEDSDTREKEDESEDQGFSINPSESVFSGTVQDRVTATSTSRKKDFDDRSAIAYKFTYRHENGETHKGTAWLHETTGMPLFTEYTLDPLPKHVKSMRMETRYFAQDENTWYLVEMDIRGSGGFLWIKRQFETHLTFSKYFQHKVVQEKSDAK